MGEHLGDWTTGTWRFRWRLMSGSEAFDHGELLPGSEKAAIFQVLINPYLGCIFNNFLLVYKILAD